MRPLRPRRRTLLNLAKSTQTVYYKTWGFHHILYRSKHASVNVMDPVNILGIETSCDDTGTAVVNGCGQVLGEGYYSQVKTSVKFGGILPSVARKYHEQYIEQAVIEAFEKSSLSPDKITAVAATVKPGNTRSLTVGAEFGKNLALKHNLPFIPIHHMEAHALTVRMENKVARRMKLRNICGMDKMVGGRAIEVMAKGGDPTRFPFTFPMTDQNDANFSFSGLASYTLHLIKQFENEKGIEGGIVLDEAKDLCASFQCSLFNHILRRTHKGLKFAEVTERIPKENKTLVISGGVASNQLLRVAFEKLCEREEYRLLIPPPKLCTDNGIMVAWNGVEKWKTGKGILHGADEIRAVIVQHQCPLGANLSSEHRRLRLYYPKCVKIPFATDISL